MISERKTELWWLYNKDFLYQAFLKGFITYAFAGYRQPEYKSSPVNGGCKFYRHISQQPYISYILYANLQDGVNVF